MLKRKQQNINRIESSLLLIMLHNHRYFDYYGYLMFFRNCVCIASLGSKHEQKTLQFGLVLNNEYMPR